MTSFLSLPLELKILIFEIVAIDNFDLQNLSKALSPRYKNETEKIMFAKLYVTHQRHYYDVNRFYVTDIERVKKLTSKVAIKYLSIQSVGVLFEFIEETVFSTDELETLEIHEYQFVPRVIDYGKLQNVRKIITGYIAGVAYEEFKNLEELTISYPSSYFTNPRNVISKPNAKIGKLSNLLKIQMTGLLEIEWIKGLRNIIELKFNRCELENMKLCDFFKKLRILDLSNNKITKIEGLTNCPNLIELNLSENAIRKLKGLGNLEKLEFLNLRGNPIREIEHHEGFQFGNADIKIYKRGGVDKINTLNILANFDHLSIVSTFSWCTPFKLGNLKRFPNLKSVDLRYSNERVEWDYLQYQLEWLELPIDGYKRDAKALPPANKSLQYLDCGTPQLKSLDELLIFTGLRTLKINYGYDIKDWTPLSRLSNLTKLKISKSGIEDLKFLQQLSSIEYLDLSGNLITCLEDLQYCQSLRYLNLGFNNIHDTEKLSLLKSLQVLNVERNSISDYSPLTKLGFLKMLCMGSRALFLCNRDVLVINTFKPLDDILKFFVAMSQDPIQIHECYDENWLDLVKEYQNSLKSPYLHHKLSLTVSKIRAMMTRRYDGVERGTVSTFKHV